MKIKFAFTIKKLGSVSSATEESYKQFFQRLRNCGIEAKYKFAETDSKGKLHYHGLILMNKNFYRNRLRIRGFSTFFKKITDEEGWFQYCTKQIQFLDKKKIMFDKTI